MCLAVPALVVALLPNEQAMVELGGIRKSVSVALVDGVQVGDHVVVHVGHAIGVIDPEEAAQTLALFAEMEAFNQAQGGTGGEMPGGAAP